jgi:YbbR domain-containing protein
MKTKGFWGRFFSDWPAKLLSLATALLIFFFYNLNRLEQRSVTVPLSVQVNSEYVPSSQYPRTVKLSLKGESNSIFQLQEEDFRASIDLSEVHGEGLARAVVQVEKRGNALGIDPLEISPEPATVSVEMEKKASRVVPVTPNFSGYLDPGYELRSFDLKPGEVEIVGPESSVSKVGSIGTEPIELSGRNGDFTVRARLARGSVLVSVPGTDSVELRGLVAKSVAMKSFTALPLVASGLEDGLALAEPLPAVKLGVKSAEVELKGLVLPPDALSVDFSSIRKPGSYTLPIATKLPEGVSVESLVPDSVTVKIVARQGVSE